MAARNIDRTKSPLQEEQYVVFNIDQHMFALGVSVLEDVIINQQITPVPLAPRYVLGCINLRGRVVTILDANLLLGIEQSTNSNKIMVVIEFLDHLYGFKVDQVTKIMEVGRANIISNPGNISETWMSISKGIFKYENRLVLVLDSAKFIASFVDE